MDPITAATLALIGAVFVANRVATASRKKTQEAPAPPAAKPHVEEPVRVGVGGRDHSQPGNDAGGEARQLPAEHLRALTVVKDPKSGKFVKSDGTYKKKTEPAPTAAAA